MRRSIVAAVILATGLSPVAEAADPAFVPDGPVKIVVGFQPGGIGDTVARLFSDAVQKQLGQRVVVENRSGANGMIAFEAIARGKADGMTLVQCTTGPMGVSPVLPGLVLPIDMNKDLVPVARFVQANWGIAVPKNSPYATLADLIADAKKKPGVLNYGHSGVGSLQQLAAEWLAVKAGFRMQGISYRGTGPAIIELMGGRIDLVVTSLGDFSSQAKGGELRVLTLIDDVGTPQFPNAPQASATVPGYTVTGWVGVCGPRGLPPAAIRWWEKATEAALTDPDLQKRLPEFGLTPGYEGAADFAKTISAEQARWKAVIDASGIRAE
jgi:tripartite-type tricarboxylate transporter receptor subunit TctC